MILPLEKQVCSLELAQELKSLGVPQESLFYWTGIDSDPSSWSVETNPYASQVYSAYTVGELEVLLPRKINDSILGIEKTVEIWWVLYSPMHDNEDWSTNDRLEEALAKMLAYLLKNKLLKPEDMGK